MTQCDHPRRGDVVRPPRKPDKRPANAVDWLEATAVIFIILLLSFSEFSVVSYFNK